MEIFDNKIFDIEGLSEPEKQTLWDREMMGQKY